MGFEQSSKGPDPFSDELSVQIRQRARMVDVHLKPGEQTLRSHCKTPLRRPQSGGLSRRSPVVGLLTCCDHFSQPSRSRRGERWRRDQQVPNEERETARAYKGPLLRIPSQLTAAGPSRIYTGVPCYADASSECVRATTCEQGVSPIGGRLSTEGVSSQCPRPRRTTLRTDSKRGLFRSGPSVLHGIGASLPKGRSPFGQALRILFGQVLSPMRRADGSPRGGDCRAGQRWDRSLRICALPLG